MHPGDRGRITQGEGDALNQQINLYQPIFRRQKKVFSAVTMLQICAFFVVVFTSLYLYTQMRLQLLQEQMDRVNHDISQMNIQMSRREAKTPVVSNSKLLENEIAKLGGELEKRKQVQALLSSQQVGNTSGLSVYLESFARQHVQGMWLTGFTISSGGKMLGLRGKTLYSELVPVYIAKLADELPLKGTSFNVMELSLPAEPTSQMDFYVSTN